MSSSSLEVVHEGWLTKSPPSKGLWRAKWRRRWFVLRHSGELPGQFVLEYFADCNCQKLKGRIDLDQCEQVDAGLTFKQGKHRYQYLFDVRTPKRVYYLAAESEADMAKWVDCICQVCGLKAYNREDEYYDYMPPADGSSVGGNSLAPSTAPSSSGSSRSPSPPPANPSPFPSPSPHRTPSPSPPHSPSSSISGPYIPISECITGRPIRGSIEEAEFYDMPRRLGPAPEVNWNTYPRAESSDRDTGSIRQGGVSPANPALVSAPPRPPKPAHLRDTLPSEAVPIVTENADAPAGDPEVTPTCETPPTATLDDTYDFPRSHTAEKRGCYTNAAPGQADGTVFFYDFQTAGPDGTAPPPPVVNRQLKPGRKTSDSVVSGSTSSLRDWTAVGSSQTLPSSWVPPPSVDRTLKPHRPLLNSVRWKGRRRSEASSSDDDVTLNADGTWASLDEQALRYGGGRRGDEIQYLDLDLESEGAGKGDWMEPGSGPETGGGIVEPSPGVVYDKVDFVKTNAFNKTRHDAEAMRKPKANNA